MSPVAGAYENAEGATANRPQAVLDQEVHEVQRRRWLMAGRVLLGVCLLAGWQMASGRLIDPVFVSSPLDVLNRLVSWITTGTLFPHLAITLWAMLAGFVVGALGGFAVGFLLGRFDSAAVICDPYITAIYCLPKIALAPLFIVWFGIGISSKIAMSATIVFFLIFLNTFAGVRDVNPVHLHVVRIMGAGEWQLLRKVILPSAAAWVFTGLKVSVPYALIGAVVGEFMSSNRGVGFLIAQSSALFDSAGVFAGLLILALAGMIINGGLKSLETRVLRWRGN